MSRDDIQKLMGGYATGTLTPEEQQALFEAALDDQELFDTLAREQALRDLLRDPAAKGQLLAALEQRPARWYEGLVRGWRPLAGAVAMAGVGAIAVVVWQGGRPPKQVLVARVNEPPAAANPAPTRPADAAAALPGSANPAPQPTAVQDNNAPAERDKDAAPGRQARESRARVAAGPERVSEENRRTSAKEKVATQSPESKEVADSLTQPRALPKGTATLPPASPPATPRTFANGSREGVPPAGSGLGGRPSAPQPLADSAAAPLFRSRTPNPAGMPGGASGGVIGGVIGGKPAPPPPPPPPPAMPPPKAEAPAQSAQVSLAPPESAPSQAKQSQSGPSQSVQGQQASAQSPSAQSGRGQQDARSELERVRLAQQAGSTAATVEVTASAASLEPPAKLDAPANVDAESLFYGDLGDPASLKAPSTGGKASGGGGGGSGRYSSAQATPPAQARKKATGQPENAQAIAVNAAAGNRAQTRPLNLGVRYSLLRKTAAGGFDPVDPDSVKTGDTLAVQLTPNERGSLLVQARISGSQWHEVLSRNVEAWNTYATPPLKSDEAELQVTFARLPVVLTGAFLRDDKSDASVSRQSTTEPATYVVTSPASTQLHFTITLNYK